MLHRTNSLRIGAKVAVRSRLYAGLRPYSTEQPGEIVFKDIVIVGAGPAGLSLAAALKNSPVTRHLDICVLESQSVERLKNWKEGVQPEHFENRVSSLTPRSARFLKSLKAWDHLAEDRVQAYDEMRVWDGVSGASIDFDVFQAQSGDAEDATEIAYMVENSNLQQALYHRMVELGHGDVLLDGVRVANVHRPSRAEGTLVVPPWPRVELEDGRSIASRLLVGADGQMSPVRRYAKIQSRGWSYERSGLVASLKLEYDDFRTVAYQRFLPSGPIALLPMPDGCATLVWSTLPERAKWLQRLDPSAFCAVVNAGFRLEVDDIDYLHSIDPSASATIIDEVSWRLERTQGQMDPSTTPVPVESVDEGTRAAFPLKMAHADTYIGDRVALVGDAAHTTHPLAGQGLNMGQRDVELLMNALETSVDRGLDIGSPLALEPYWKASYLPNHLKLGVVDKLHKIYSTDWWPLVQLRSIGLTTVDRAGFIKQFLMRQASS